MANNILPLSPGKRRYGRYADNPNSPAKRIFALHTPLITLAPKATTSQWKGHTRDQEQEGSCTGQMKAECRDWLYRKSFAFEKDQTVPVDQFEASADFAYLTNLIADGTLGQDAGSSIHQSFVTLNREGCCLQTQEPYHDTDYTVAPTAAQYTEALTYKGGAYHSLTDLFTMKSVIASGYAFGFGIIVYSSFEANQQFTDTGFMPMPQPIEGVLGGHAQFALDYDDTLEFPDWCHTNGAKGGILVQNSWGSGWGINAPGHTDGGCYWMPYSFFGGSGVDGPYVSDAWVMHLGKSWK